MEESVADRTFEICSIFEFEACYIGAHYRVA
jgi:hypothetical protein